MDDGFGSGRGIPPRDSEPCDVCGAVAMEAWLEVSLLGFRTADIHACKSCGFRQARPRLGDLDIAGLYPAEHFLPGGADIGYGDYSREAQRAERDGYFLARRLRRLLPRGGRLLEVGCGLGFLLGALARFAPRFEAEGVDISEFGVRFTRSRTGLTVHAGTLESARFPDGRFDVILQKDVLEHVRAPREHLKETARVLKAGGLLWLVTPNGDANLAPYAALARRDPDRLPLFQTGHLSFFRKEHLTRLLAGCGLEIVNLRNLKLVAGLKALGRLPRNLAGIPSLPRSGSAAPAAAAPPEEASLDLMAAAVEASHSRIRSLVPYFWLRHLLRAWNNAPAFLPYGTDFEILARKSAVAR